MIRNILYLMLDQSVYKMPFHRLTQDILHSKFYHLIRSMQYCKMYFNTVCSIEMCMHVIWIGIKIHKHGNCIRRSAHFLWNRCNLRYLIRFTFNDNILFYKITLRPRNSKTLYFLLKGSLRFQLIESFKVLSFLSKVIKAPT